MRKILFGIFILFVLSWGGGKWFLSSPRASAGLICWGVAHFSPDVRITELRIGAQRYSGWEAIGFDDVFAKITLPGQKISVHLARMEISDWIRIFSKDKRLGIRVSGAEVAGTPWEAKGVAADLGIVLGTGSIYISGPVTAEAVRWDKAQAGTTSFRCVYDGKEVRLTDIHAAAYGGVIEGDARAALRPVVYTADVTLTGWEAEKLSGLHEQFSIQLAGRITGTLHLAGDTRRLGEIAADFSMPLGGRINQELFRMLTRYLSPSLEEVVLGALQKVAGKVPVEVFSFSVKNRSTDHFSGEVHVASRAANLNLNLTHDIHADGTWEGLAQAWSAVFQ